MTRAERAAARQIGQHDDRRPVALSNAPRGHVTTLNRQSDGPLTQTQLGEPLRAESCSVFRTAVRSRNQATRSSKLYGRFSVSSSVAGCSSVSDPAVLIHQLRQVLRRMIDNPIETPQHVFGIRPAICERNAPKLHRVVPRAIGEIRPQNLLKERQRITASLLRYRIQSHLRPQYCDALTQCSQHRSSFL